MTGVPALRAPLGTGQGYRSYVCAARDFMYLVGFSIGITRHDKPM